jgi:hypothetical protein
MINEAAEALMNDETTSLGKYTFEPIASGLGGTRVNIYVEPGMEDSVGYFMLDPGEYREPSDMLDAFYDKISEFLENNPDSEEGTGGTGPGAKFMPASRASLVDRIVKDANARVEDRLKGESAWLSPRGWVNVDDHLDIFPEDLFDLRRVNYDDLKDRRFVRVRRMGRTLWYEGRPTPKMLKELKDTAVEKKLKLEEDRIEPRGSSARFMPAGPLSSSQDDQSLAGVPAPVSDQAPLSGTGLGASFMPGYNPRYTDEDGNFDREAWLADIKKGEEYLRRRGITRANTRKDIYEQMLRDALRGPRR